MKRVKRGMNASHSLSLMCSINRWQERHICRLPSQSVKQSVKLRLTADPTTAPECHHGHCRVPRRLPASSPEHQIHQLKPLPFEEALPIGWQHQAGAQGVKEVLHHLLLLGRGRVVAFEHLRRREGVQIGAEGSGCGGWRRSGATEFSVSPKAAAVAHRCPPSRPVIPCYLPRRNVEEMQRECRRILVNGKTRETHLEIEISEYFSSPSLSPRMSTVHQVQRYGASSKSKSGGTF